MYYQWTKEQIRGYRPESLLLRRKGPPYELCGTFSNLVFPLAGAPAALLGDFPAFVVFTVLGLLSGIYHAYHEPFTAKLDVLAMGLVFGYLLAGAAGAQDAAPRLMVGSGVGILFFAGKRHLMWIASGAVLLLIALGGYWLALPPMILVGALYRWEGRLSEQIRQANREVGEDNPQLMFGVGDSFATDELWRGLIAEKLGPVRYVAAHAIHGAYHIGAAIVLGAIAQAIAGGGVLV